MPFFSYKTKLRLARSIVTKSQPVYVQFYVTARCNLACEQCNIIYANSDVSEIDLRGVGRIAENLERIGVSIVLLTGGEPFARADLPEIVREFARRGIHVRMQTNGLATEKKIQACIEAGSRDISISLDSIRPDVQDRINGGVAGSWERAIETVSTVNRIFPEDAFAAFGCVLAPTNLAYIPDLIRFATRIGWYVSLVPAHTTTFDRPLGFRSFDSAVRFEPEHFPLVRRTIDEVRRMRNEGFLLYDSDEYLEDMFRLVCGDRVRWRDRNDGVCDSPNLYFAISPNGDLAVCCDWRPGKRFSVADENFPEIYRSESLRREIEPIVSRCGGCLYGSFPEMTISCRHFVPMLRRALFFNMKKDRKLAKLSKEEMLGIAEEIRQKKPELYR
jgi:MoaA/NifB/PqqE/SkfB family radical SAM enzyme